MKFDTSSAPTSRIVVDRGIDGTTIVPGQDYNSSEAAQELVANFGEMHFNKKWQSLNNDQRAEAIRRLNNERQEMGLPPVKP